MRIRQYHFRGWSCLCNHWSVLHLGCVRDFWGLWRCFCGILALRITQSAGTNTTDGNGTEVVGRVQCLDDVDCRLTYGRNGTFCLQNGYCSNPFYNQGCLAQMSNHTSDVGKKKFLRVCSSADPPEAATNGHCILHSTLMAEKRANDGSNMNQDYWNYPEVRLAANNWESAMFSTWIMQIVLSEILSVPTTVETGDPHNVLDFYDIYDRFDFGDTYQWEGIRNSKENLYCRKGDSEQITPNIYNETTGSYKPCAHVSLEVWSGAKEYLDEFQDLEIIEKPLPMGVLATSGWFLPRFTAQNDSTLLTYFGLTGSKNREKLANTFLRPTKWRDYCEEVSSTNCTVPDEVAQRAPSNQFEYDQYFSFGAFNGFFRKTIENDCMSYPNNCTGHIVDYPCGWTSYVQQQVSHLDIALQSSGDMPYSRGYTYNQMIEIWMAANWTKSHVIMMWWEPETLVQLFAGTEAEFQRVTLPSPTQECLENRVKVSDRCQPEISKRIGQKEGSCDEPVQALTKVVTNALFQTSNDLKVPVALRSPAYETIKKFQLSNLQLASILNDWINSRVHTDDFYEHEHHVGGTFHQELQQQRKPREAVCDWVVSNYDEIMQTFIPRTFPRTQRMGEDVTGAGKVYYVSLVFSLFVLVLVVTVLIGVYLCRKRRVFMIAQIEFVFLIIFGLLLIQIGSILTAVQPTNAVCVSTVWFVYFGYNFELVPLIVKVGAIHHLRSAAMQMKRITISKQSLFASVALISFIMGAFLVAWSVADPPSVVYEYELTNRIINDEESNNNGDTIVMVFKFCQSEQFGWIISAFCMRLMLLAGATVLAYLTRKSPINVNESKILGVIIYCQFSFLIWNIVLLLVGQVSSALSMHEVARYQSIIQSIEVTAIICMYIVPKLFTTDKLYANTLQKFGWNNSGIEMPPVYAVRQVSNSAVGAGCTVQTTDDSQNNNNSDRTPQHQSCINNYTTSVLDIPSFRKETTITFTPSSLKHRKLKHFHSRKQVWHMPKHVRFEYDDDILSIATV